MKRILLFSLLAALCVVSCKDSSAKISVEATDPYGNTYTCSDVVTDGQNYPENIKIRLSIF